MKTTKKCRTQKIKVELDQYISKKIKGGRIYEKKISKFVNNLSNRVY